MENIIFNSRPLELKKYKVLKNTYLLLALTIFFSAFVAMISTILSWPNPGILLTLLGFYTLFFLTNYFSNSLLGIACTFALTGFLGYCLGPILGLFLSFGMGEIVFFSLAGTSAIFFFCSFYVLVSGKDLSFFSGTLSIGSVVLLILMISNIFLKITALHMTISAIFILFSSISIMWETNRII